MQKLELVFSGAEFKSMSQNQEVGAVFTGFIKLIITCFIALLILGYTFGTVVRPGYMGIRQVMLGPKNVRGFSKEALTPGYHWSIPFYSKIHIIPKKVQILNFNRNPQRSSNEQNFLEVQTRNGSSVQLDLSILIRYLPKSGEMGGIVHGGPNDLIQKLGISQNNWESTVYKVSQDELRRALGRISTSEFYDPTLRENMLTEAHENLNQGLAQYGIMVEAVLLRRYIYAEARIDNAIFLKNLQDQEERLNASRGKYSEAKASLERVAAEMDADITTLRIEGDNKSTVLRSEGDRYIIEQQSKGDLLVAKAEADIKGKKGELLSRMQSSTLYVAREMAPMLSSLRGGVVSNIDPYDVDGWIKRFGLAER